MLGRVAKEYRFEKLWDMSIVNQCIYATENIFDEILPDIKEKLVCFLHYLLIYYYYFLICGDYDDGDDDYRTNIIFSRLRIFLNFS